MNKFETIWRFLVTSLAVWRLSRVLFGELGRSRTAEDAREEPGAGRFWAGRAVDFVCWISVWLSSQTAIWVACGFAGVFLSWLSMAGVSRLFAREAKESAEAESTEGHCLRCVDGMQAHHG